MQQPQGDQQHAPDQHTQRAWRCERPARQDQRRQATDAGLPAQKRHVAEQVVQTQPPGDRAQWQVVARQFDGHGAERPGDGEGHNQPERQTGPRQSGQTKYAAQHQGSVRRGTHPGRCVSAHTDKGRLAKRRHAAHAGQHDQAGSHQRIQPDIAQDHHRELWQKRPADREQGHRSQRQLASGHDAACGRCAFLHVTQVLQRRAHCSSSTWRLDSERHHSTGMISVNTNTSLKALAQNEEKDSSCPTSSAPASASG